VKTLTLKNNKVDNFINIKHLINILWLCKVNMYGARMTSDIAVAVCLPFLRFTGMWGKKLHRLIFAIALSELHLLR